MAVGTEGDAGGAAAAVVGDGGDAGAVLDVPEDEGLVGVGGGE
jgi:hypothetical protein